VPGILPVEDMSRTLRFAESCGASVPGWMLDAYGKAEDAAARQRLSVALAAGQCDDLIAHGVGRLHFYTLNKAALVYQVCHALGVESEPLTVAAGCG